VQPDGNVSTLAGSAYGHLDGKGAAATIGALEDGFRTRWQHSIYGRSLSAQVAMDGTVTTIAKDLTVQQLKTSRRCWWRLMEAWAGLSVDSGGNVFVADAGNGVC